MTAQTAMCEISLSPATWLEGEFERLERMTLSRYERPKPLAVSAGKGLVAGTTEPFAVHSGMDALRKGGNAMDACLATALTEVTLATGSYVSYAGVTQILYYEKSSNKVYSINGGWNTPLHGDPSQIPKVHTTGDNGASVLVPGFIAGVADAAAKFAKFPLKTLFEPALYFAENGFKMSIGMATLIKLNYNDVTLLRTSQGKNIFTNPDTGKPYAYNELFKQSELAGFIKNVSANAKDYFYNGTWAYVMTSLIQDKKGFLTSDDMRRYQTKWEEPVNTSYNDHDVYVSGNDWGGVELVEKLRLMELAGIGQRPGSNYLTNATEFFWLASISRFSFFVSTFLQSSPNGLSILKENLDLDLSNRLSRDSAEAIWKRIGSPEKMREVNAVIKELLGGKEGEKGSIHGSDSVVAADKDGNVCSMIHTINSKMWGTGLFVQGIALPHSGAIFKSYIKQTSPGERLSTGLQPAIAFKSEETSQGRRPVMALSVVGSSYPVVVPQYVTNLLDSDMNPKEAMESPTFLMPAFSDFFQAVPIEEFSVAENVLQEVRDMGQGVTELEYLKAFGPIGLGVALTIDDNGIMYGCTHPLRRGLAEGV
ncbi:glutathione hydrolase-like YwrD proenzyme isoform X2 [Oculina patagonica]